MTTIQEQIKKQIQESENETKEFIQEETDLNLINLFVEQKRFLI
jgi:hypothetical protein